MSLAPCSLRPTRFFAAESIFENNLRSTAPWWLRFDDAAPASVLNSSRRDRDDHFGSSVFNREICTVHDVHAYTVYCAPVLPAAERNCCQFRRKTAKLAKRPRGVLEGFLITIFNFNEMLHSRHILETGITHIHGYILVESWLQTPPAPKEQHWLLNWGCNWKWMCACSVSGGPTSRILHADCFFHLQSKTGRNQNAELRTKKTESRDKKKQQQKNMLIREAVAFLRNNGAPEGNNRHKEAPMVRQKEREVYIKCTFVYELSRGDSREATWIIKSNTSKSPSSHLYHWQFTHPCVEREEWATANCCVDSRSGFCQVQLMQSYGDNMVQWER